jgi:hypothetical protein
MAEDGSTGSRRGYRYLLIDELAANYSHHFQPSILKTLTFSSCRRKLNVSLVASEARAAADERSYSAFIHCVPPRRLAAQTTLVDQLWVAFQYRAKQRMGHEKLQSNPAAAGSTSALGIEGDCR